MKNIISYFLVIASLLIASCSGDDADQKIKPFNMTDVQIEQAYKTVTSASGKGYVVDVKIVKGNKTLTITHKYFDTDDGRKLNDKGRKMMRDYEDKQAKKWCDIFPDIRTVIINNTKSFRKGSARCWE